MNHKEFLSSLPSDVTQSLTQKRDAPGLRHLIVYFGLILALGIWIATAAPLWWALLPVQGALIVFLFTLEHEATHKTPFANERLNEWVGRLCGLLIFLPFEWFRYFHLAHHRFTNIEGKDPELQGSDGRHMREWVPFLWHVSGLPYWGSMLRQIVVNAFSDPSADYLPARAIPRVRREARILLAIYFVAALNLLITPLLFWVWIMPALLGQPFLRLYLMAEHGRCPKVANMFDNTRTTYTNHIMRFLAWNMPYHTEHHVHPAVPFHKLPELHQLMREHLLHEQDGYVRFTQETIREL